MKVCSKCGVNVPDDEVTMVSGEVLCDDCSIMLSMQRTVTPCDNVAGLKYTTAAPSDELTKRQQEILNYLKEKKNSMLEIFTYMLGHDLCNCFLM